MDPNRKMIAVGVAGTIPYLLSEASSKGELKKPCQIFKHRK